MAYTPTEWKDGDLISAARMNKLEQGVANEQVGPPGPQGEPGAQGPQGEQGPAGADGKDGKDGKTPFIGSNGNWWIGETDTGISAGGAGGGVTTFNGRSGDVVPMTGDYTAAQVGAVPADAVKLVQVLTEAEYAALSTKNAATLYLIKE